MAPNRGLTRIRGTTFRSPHGLLVGLLDRVFVISTKSYSDEDMQKIIQIRYVLKCKLPSMRRCLTRAQVPRRGCHPHSRHYECPDDHGHANDTAVFAQPDFMCPDAGSEMKGGTSRRGGPAEGVYVFHGQEAKCSVVEGAAGIARIRGNTND